MNRLLYSPRATSTSPAIGTVVETGSCFICNEPVTEANFERNPSPFVSVAEPVRDSNFVYSRGTTTQGSQQSRMFERPSDDIGVERFRTLEA